MRIHLYRYLYKHRKCARSCRLRCCESDVRDMLSDVLNTILIVTCSGESRMSENLMLLQMDWCLAFRYTRDLLLEFLDSSQHKHESFGL